MRLQRKYITIWKRILRRAVTCLAEHEAIPRRAAAGLLALWLTVTLYSDKHSSSLIVSELTAPSTEILSDISTVTHTSPRPVFGEIHFHETDILQKE